MESCIWKIWNPDPDIQHSMYPSFSGLVTWDYAVSSAKPVADLELPVP